jgi:hypothetical protein
MDSETHVSILKSIHAKLKAIAEKERRSMRTVLTRLIENEYNKVFK